MAVAEQTPYIEYTANGATTNFSLGFDCESKDHLIVTVNGVEPLLTDWSLVDGAVVFNTAPINGSVVVIQRNTPFARPTDYQTYNNSFRAPAVNNDFDRIWLKLQELGVTDWILGNRIDALKAYVDDKDNELRAFLLAEIQAQGVSLDQLDQYYNYLMRRLAEIAVNRGWMAEFVIDATGRTQQEINDLIIDPVTGKAVASKVYDASGKTQQQLNNGLESIADLATIPTPQNGNRVYIKSYYAGLNSGGGEFVFKAGAAETEVQGFVINVTGGVWKRVIQNVHSIDDAGAHPTKSPTINANAINSVLSFVKNVQVPNEDYSVDPDIIKLNNRNVLFGNGRLIGTAPDTLGIADGTGIYIHADDTDTAIVRGLTLKNGYKSNGIFLRRAKNILIDDVTVDGMSYGITVAEKDFNTPDSGGCENIVIQNPKILNTRYWGIYLRGAGIATETLKTQNIKVINPYFYNCNMAGFVASEGNVKNFVLENPVFNRCNVCMHFENASEFTVTNARDFDTGKKPDHVPANTEYPFVNWSMYHAFSRKAKIVDCTLSATVSHLAGTAADVRVYDIEYSNTKALTFVFEGVGALDSTNKSAFKNISWDRCTTEREFIYHQALDEARSWLRDFSITNSTCKLGAAGNSGSGSYVAIGSPRAKNMRIDNNTIHNATLRIACEDNLFVTKNTWIGGTDNTEVVIEGLRGGLFGDFCEFTGNMFERAGGTVQGDAAVRMSTFTRIRADNVLRGVGVGYAYRFANNYRIELGAGLIYDYPLGQFVETGTIGGIVYLSRA